MRYPDLKKIKTYDDALKASRRKSFRADEYLFVWSVDKDAYINGNVVVFHDQQDSTSWYAKVGGTSLTTYPKCFWAPEYAVEKLLEFQSALVRLDASEGSSLITRSNVIQFPGNP